MPVSVEVAARLQLLLRTVFGEHGAPLLAEELDVPYRVLLRWTMAEEELPDEVARQISAICGCSLEWLRTGMEPMFPASTYGQGPEMLN